MDGSVRHRLSTRLPRLAAVLALLVSPLAQADPPGTHAEATAPQVVPPELVTPAELVYPEEALAEGAHGDVTVLVDVDASGAVVGVSFESGPEVFQQAALDAAWQLGFSPALRDGQPVAVTTRVYFHFAPPEELADSDEIVVHYVDPDLQGTRARTTLDEDALEASAGQDLAETLTQVPGVTLSRGTGDTAKPIIRGQTERRLLVLYDGVRHEGQKWGPDHATEIDPFSAGEISVIRGAAGARYGPDAIGGVVLVTPPPLREDPGISGRGVVYFATNGLRPHGALRLDAVPAGLDQLSLRIEGDYARGATLSAPDYLLGNTASETWNLGAAARLRWNQGEARLSWHHYDLRAGVFYGVQNSTPDEFEEQLLADTPPTAELWTRTYVTDRPYQDVTHDLFALHLSQEGDWGALVGTYAFQLNHRQEFEQVREGVEDAQYDFTLRTHSLDVVYTQPEVFLGSATLTGEAGLQGGFQENVYRGLTLIPSFRGFSGGVFAHERLQLGRVDLEAGGRYDHLSRTAWLDSQAWQRHLRQGTVDDGLCTELDNGARCAASYDTGSVSLGALVHLVPQVLDLKLDLSQASRFPNIDELYLIGSAPTLPVYAVSDPGLGVETAWTGSTTLGLRTRWVTGELSAYGGYIADYIYFAPELNDDGSLHYDVTIRGSWPTYSYRALDVTMMGADGGVQLGPELPVGLALSGSLVRIQEAATGQHLVGVVPDRARIEAIVRAPDLGPVSGLTLTVSTDLVAKQTRTDLDADFAPPPDGYVLLGAGVSARIALGRRSLRLGISGFNLLDTAYRDYTSLLRYYADQPGRDLHVRVGFDL